LTIRRIDSRIIGQRDLRTSSTGSVGRFAA
jgi:hypothetical protein